MLLKSSLVGMSVLGAAALAVALLAMVAVSPSQLGPLGVTGWFLVVFVGLSALAGVVADLTVGRLQPRRNSRQRLFDAGRRGLMIGGFITISLGLNSLQQLNWRAILILAVLLGLVEFYTVARS